MPSPSRVFPELCLTGYAIDDLVMQDAVLDAVEAAIARLVEASADLFPVLVVGAPLRHRNRLYNCAVVIHRGELLGVAPKSYLPTYREFYERRWYAPGDDQAGEDIRVGDLEAPFGPDLLFEALDVPGLVVHAEVCEDVWVPIPPSSHAALAGATVLLNLSGSPITIARAEDRKDLCQSQSLRCLAAYAYAAAGMGESTNDLSWDGQTMIYEGGTLLAETERFPDGPRQSVADVDLDRLRQDRLRQGTFDDNRRTADEPAHASSAPSHFELEPPARDIGLRRTLDRFPFVPDDPARLAQDCYEAFNIQVSGLVQRMEAIGAAEARHRRERRARLDARAAGGRSRDGPHGTAAQRHPRVHDAGLRDDRAHEVERDRPRRVGRRLDRDDRHPCRRDRAARGHRPPVQRRRAASTTSRSRTSRRACAPTSSSASPTSTAGWSSARPTCRSSRSAGRPTASATR